MAERKDDSLLELFIFETLQNAQQLEKIILDTGAGDRFSEAAINEIFRIMHTVKGSAAMMSYSHISSLAHKIEDLFFYIRETPDAEYDIGTVSDFVLSFIDFINEEIEVIKSDGEQDAERAEELGKDVEKYLSMLKNEGQAEGAQAVKSAEAAKGVPAAAESAGYKVTLFFEDGCGMENIRAYAALLEIAEYAKIVSFIPTDIEENDGSAEEIRKNGFTVYFESEASYDELQTRFENIPLVHEVVLTKAENEGVALDDTAMPAAEPDNRVKTEAKDQAEANTEIVAIPQAAEKAASQNGSQDSRKTEAHQPTQSIISVHVSKLDKLMNLVGELVIAESMVVENPDLKGMQLPSFQREAAQLHKIVDEIQELVMSMRLMPLATVFQRTNRIVRDMSRKLGKQVKLKITGEETEVDKNIIEHLSDPILHLVRNCVDHGIESREERIAAGKPEAGTISIEAYSAGSYVYIIVSDDGRGLDKQKILEKAMRNGLLKKSPESMTDKEIYNLIFLPGFSTSETVTEFSGRGVGMDVVMQSIGTIGGNVSVDSTPGQGTSIMMKIPLTVAIIDGMNVTVGDRLFTIPISNIRESFKPDLKNVFRDPDGREMVMVRGECYAIVRLHEIWGIETSVTELSDGILVMVEQEERRRCIFVDSLIGQQQVVVKSMPELIKRSKLAEGFAGCTLLGDGSISLIFDVSWLVSFDI